MENLWNTVRKTLFGNMKASNEGTRTASLTKCRSCCIMSIFTDLLVTAMCLLVGICWRIFSLFRLTLKYFLGYVKQIARKTKLVNVSIRMISSLFQHFLEAAIEGVLKKLFLKIWKESPTQVLSCELFRNIFFIVHFWTATSDELPRCKKAFKTSTTCNFFGNHFS